MLYIASINPEDADMTATETLTKFSAECAAELRKVQAQYTSLAESVRLMKRHAAASIVEAMETEAKQRVLRNQWAAVTAGA